MLLLPLGCSVLPWNWSGHDPQKVQIFYQYFAADELDTFHGTYQKDLIPGTAQTEMWLTTREQEIILYKLEEIKFFSWPDTLPMQPFSVVDAEHRNQILRIKTAGHDKSVVWHFPVRNDCIYRYSLDELKQLLNAIIESKPEYKALPHTKGVYYD
jgi:hypothetical protein